MAGLSESADLSAPSFPEAAFGGSVDAAGGIGSTGGAVASGDGMLGIQFGVREQTLGVRLDQGALRIRTEDAAPAPPMAGERKVLIKLMNFMTPALPDAA